MLRLLPKITQVRINLANAFKELGYNAVAAGMYRSVLVPTPSRTQALQVSTVPSLQAATPADALVWMRLAEALAAANARPLVGYEWHRATGTRYQQHSTSSTLIYACQFTRSEPMGSAECG